MSHAATITLVGRVGTDPHLTPTATGDRTSLRVVATERRLDRNTQEWVDGDEFGVSVVCWRTLATAVVATVRKGDPVVVTGRISTRRFVDNNGATQYYTEVKADTVGLDVGKVGNRIMRRQPDAFGGTTGGPVQPGSGVPAAGPGSAGNQPGSAGNQPSYGDPADRELPAEPDLDDDPWGLADEEPGRAGELVGSG